MAQDLALGHILATSSSGGDFDKLWKAIWSANIPSIVAIGNWCSYHELLSTRDRLRSKRYQGELGCLLCSRPYRSLGHVLCQCSTTNDILIAAPFYLRTMVSHSFGFKEWLFDCAISMLKTIFKQLLIMLWEYGVT